MLSSRIGYSCLDDIVTLRNVSLMRRFACLKDGSLPLTFYLAQVFRSVCKFDAKDTEDRIYALLGLSRSGDVDLKPDYGISMRQLYINVVSNSLEKTTPRYRLDFLAHAGSGYGQKTQNLPSWAPDWSVQISVKPFIVTEGGAELLNSRPIKSLLNDAAALASFAQFDAESGPKAHHEIALERAERVKIQALSVLYNATPGTEPFAKLLPNDVLELQGYKFDRLMLSAASFQFSILVIGERK